MESFIKHTVAIVKQCGHVAGLSPIMDYVHHPVELEHISLYNWISCCKHVMLKNHPPSELTIEGDSSDPVNDVDEVEELSVNDGAISPHVANSFNSIPVGLFRFTSAHPLYDLCC